VEQQRKYCVGISSSANFNAKNPTILQQKFLCAVQAVSSFFTTLFPKKFSQEFGKTIKFTVFWENASKAHTVCAQERLCFSIRRFTILDKGRATTWRRK